MERSRSGGGLSLASVWCFVWVVSSLVGLPAPLLFSFCSNPAGSGEPVRRSNGAIVHRKRAAIFMLLRSTVIAHTGGVWQLPEPVSVRTMLCFGDAKRSRLVMADDRIIETTSCIQAAAPPLLRTWLRPKQPMGAPRGVTTAAQAAAQAAVAAIAAPPQRGVRTKSPPASASRALLGRGAFLESAPAAASAPTPISPFDVAGMPDSAGAVGSDLRGPSTVVNFVELVGAKSAWRE